MGHRRNDMIFLTAILIVVIGIVFLVSRRSTSSPLVVNEKTIADMRMQFTEIAHRYHGDYDGWDAAVTETRMSGFEPSATIELRDNLKVLLRANADGGEQATGIGSFFAIAEEKVGVTGGAEIAGKNVGFMETGG
jgi:hypothetical protein